MGSKYGKVLTIVLIIIIVVIVGILGFFAFRIFNAGNTTKKAADKVAEFNANTETQQQDNNKQNKSNQNNNNQNNSSTSLEELANNSSNNTSENSMYEQQNNNSNSKDTYYEGYKVIGTISIPSIDIEYPILGQNNSDTLKIAVVAVYPSNPENAVNQPGNLVLWGHNYKDGTFFSNITKLTTGAKIYIKDTSGNKITYQVYNSYQTTDTDMSYARRDVGGAREISLSTCGNDSGKRDIVWAREVE